MRFASSTTSSDHTRASVSGHRASSTSDRAGSSQPGCQSPSIPGTSWSNAPTRTDMSATKESAGTSVRRSGASCLGSNHYRTVAGAFISQRCRSGFSTRSIIAISSTSAWAAPFRSTAPSGVLDLTAHECHPCRRTEKHDLTSNQKCHLCRRTPVTDVSERNCYRCSRLHTRSCDLRREEARDPDETYRRQETAADRTPCVLASYPMTDRDRVAFDAFQSVKHKATCCFSSLC